ncbi:MAG: hypothetical protein RLZZ519_2544 [Bacteroidota bacterium]
MQAIGIKSTGTKTKVERVIFSRIAIQLQRRTCLLREFQNYERTTSGESAPRETQETAGGNSASTTSPNRCKSNWICDAVGVEIGTNFLPYCTSQNL